jgi:hypothetical protein
MVLIMELISPPSATDGGFVGRHVGAQILANLGNRRLLSFQEAFEVESENEQL